jgi:DNA modification methylase
MTTNDKTKRISIPVTQIVEGDRIREDYGQLDELADSIKTEGLIHPVVVDLNYRLVAGGRRLRAVRDVLKLPEIDINFIEVLDDAQLRRLEAEENVRRKDMSWQEKVQSVAAVHNHQALNAAIKGSSWTQAMTGRLLGNYSQAHVSYALQIATLLNNDDAEINKCEGLSEAIKLLAKRAEDSALASLAKSTVSGQKVNVQDILAQSPEGDIFVSQQPSTPSGPAVGLASRPAIPELPRDVTLPDLTIPLSSMCIHSDSLAWMAGQPDASFDHVITDWPFGIDMENLERNNVHGGIIGIDDTKNEHTVEGNLDLQAKAVPEIYRLLKPNGFFVTWMDAMHWNRTYDLCIAAGFKVQRWPLIWYKTHSCMNQAAQANFTKNYEIAIVCRKGNATLVSPQSSSIWQGGIGNEKETMGHAFAKPSNLWKWLYGAIAIKGQRILDPFAGSGSSTCAAIGVGLQPVAVEVVEQHYNKLLFNVTNTYRAMNPNVKFV